MPTHAERRGHLAKTYRAVSPRKSFGASLSEPRIHEAQEAVLYVYIYIYMFLDVCGVIISVRRELNFERVR